MADKIAKGKYRWDPKFRKEFAKPLMSNTVELHDIPTSTIQGRKEFSARQEIAFGGGLVSMRVRKKATRGVSMVQMDTLLSKEQERLDGFAGGNGGHNIDPVALEKNAEVAKAVKEEHKADGAVANNVNHSSQSGNFQGGHDRIDALEKGKLVTHEDDEKNKPKKPKINT